MPQTPRQGDCIVFQAHTLPRVSEEPLQYRPMRQSARGRIMVHAERGGSLAFADPPGGVRRAADLAAASVPHAFARRSGRPCRMPLSLRIDVIETAGGCLLSECEGVEPELFFRARPGSAARFAECLERSAAAPAASGEGPA